MNNFSLIFSKLATCLSVLIRLTFYFHSFIFQMTVRRLYYFISLRHYYRLALVICVMFFLLPVNQALTPKQLGWCATTVLLSWLNLVQLLKLAPTVGIYIILVEKIFWTLLKVCYLLCRGILPPMFSIKTINMEEDKR